MMKNRLLLVGTGLACASLFFACAGNDKPADDQTAATAPELPMPPSHEEMVSRGEYLVHNIGTCTDCHSPKVFTDKGPEPNMDLFLSGHQAGMALPPANPKAVKDGWVLMSSDFTAFTGPWGTSYAANLTPDTLTGIGTWTEENWLNAFKHGKFHGLPAGRDLLPPMPWQSFGRMTDEDALSIFAYLKSLHPVRNAVPPPDPPAM